MVERTHHRQSGAIRRPGFLWGAILRAILHFRAAGICVCNLSNTFESFAPPSTPAIEVGLTDGRSVVVKQKRSGVLVRMAYTHVYAGGQESEHAAQGKGLHE